MTAEFTTTTLRAANHYDSNLPNQALMNNVCPLGLSPYFIFTIDSNNAYMFCGMRWSQADGFEIEFA